MQNIKENERLNVLNHSCAHLLAQAVKHLYPEAKFWVGPVIEEGFYYDIDLGDEVITEADLDNNGELNDFEKSVYSYNNAIDTLNTACKNIVTANDNIIDVSYIFITVSRLPTM